MDPVEPVRPDQPASLPRGPHPTLGPDTVAMPRWPGPLLAIGGALLALVALGTGTLAVDGQIDVGDPSSLAWVALAGVAIFTAGLIYVAVRQLRVRRVLPPERYRGPSVLILLALALVLAAVMTAPFAADAAALLLGTGDMTLLGSVVLLVSTQVALLLVAWTLVFRPNALAGLPALPGRDPGGAVRAGLGWGVLAWIGSSVVAYAVVVALEALEIEAAPQAAEQALNLIDPWLAVVAIVLLAPVAEELFFRGVIFNAFLREGGRRWAFLGSSALFAVIHLSIAAFVPIFLLGLALAWVYHRTGSLVAPIVMHATVNGISVLLALLLRFEVFTVPV
ncbi:MAG TPA: type II CAAX endopeptidase family protein [Candidatus Limnocylindria bacterium]|nr:type II CAAX endopeptidase family protein [Candidatus Limnocylindria bacterium]